MQIILDIPDHLEAQLQQFGDQLPELLERGLQELLSEQYLPSFLGDREIIKVLASQPTAEQILAIHPSPELQARMSQLLAQNKTNQVNFLRKKKLN
jgi:hypothetical protein